MNKHLNTIEFPLYHGTSSIFLDSIMKKGLGGQNIGDTYQPLKMFTQIVKIFQSKYRDQEWWLRNHYSIEKIVSNDVTRGNFNFRYGGVYLTPSLETATRYAKSNKYGSELISYFMKAYDELFKHEPTKAEEIFPLNHPLREVVSKISKPIVLEVLNVSKDNLTTEQGKPIEEQLDLMKTCSKVLWQQLNFESSYVIPPDQLKVISFNG